MITIQEATAVGCQESGETCPIWMYNYLKDSINNAGTSNDINDQSSGYWTITATNPESWTKYTARLILGKGSIYQLGPNTNQGARAVVVVDKPDVENTDNANINSDNRTNNENKNQVVNVADTVKSAYIGYLIGTIILILGIAVIIQTYQKYKNNI